MTIKENIDFIQKEILKISKQSNSKTPNIIAVSKKHDTKSIQEAINSGILYIGESYIQEAISKIDKLEHKHWDFIGQIQTNKIKFIVRYFNRIHSLSKFKHIQKINQIAKTLNKKPEIFIQVNIANEETKGGIVSYDNLKTLVKQILDIKDKSFTLCGLMTIPPATNNPENSRKYFIQLKNYMLNLNKELNISLNRLSMGMSRDFIVATEEGSTDLRIGTGIFGKRIY